MSTRAKRPKSFLDPADSHWDQEVTLDLKAGPYTYIKYNRDDLRGQMRSLRVLEQLLERSRREDLPAVTWTVTAHSISGELAGGLDGSPDRVRDAFGTWAAVLGMTWREHDHRSFDGSVELSGATKLPGLRAESHLEVGVGLHARWWPELDDVTTESA